MDQENQPQTQSQPQAYRESQTRNQGYRSRPHYNRGHNQPRNNWRPHNSRGRGRGGHRLNQYSDRRRLDDQGTELANNNQPLGSNENLSRQDDPNPKDESDNIQSQISEIELKSNSFECMICCDNIRRQQPIWSCNNCYNIFHLKCAIEWCNKSIKSRNEAMTNAAYPSLSHSATGGRQTLTVDSITNHTLSDTNEANAGNDIYARDRQNSVEWPCPACREILHVRPNKYKCFCGKVIRPDINRHLTPHSCGQLCGRQRPNADCPHSCNSICHPGRCNPCPLTSKKSCYCGKLVREVKCSVGKTSCDQICGNTLSCGRHKCTKICHEGGCDICQEIIIISCFCGSQSIERRCTELNMPSNKKLAKGFSCAKQCDRLLDCGKHRCPEKCHPGPDCSSCKLKSENIKTCPCGSTQIKKTLLSERQSCTEPIPVCGNKCNRPLPCGPEKNHHRCQKKCHNGPCPPCKLKTTLRCRCRSSTKTVDCSKLYDIETDEYSQIQHQVFNPDKESFICETRCNKLKNCGRHRCQNKCCESGRGDSTRPDLARVHICDAVCNRKLPCAEHNCPEPCHPGQCGDCTNIGWSELSCHCGASVMYPPVPCGARPPTCHGPCRRAHSCGHPVKHECHDDSEKCAPCIVFVEKSCFCGADTKNSVYCYLPGYSCGRTCKKPLACRQHQCKRVCHDGPCETPNDRGIIMCDQPCPVVRYNCKHPCALPCHGKTPCKPSDCRKVLEITCECGNKTERIECFKVMKDVDMRNKVAMMSTRRTDGQDSIVIDLSKKPAPRQATGGGQTAGAPLKQLECDESCALLKRNKALAEALDLDQPDLRPSSIFGEDPLRLLREATVRDYKFVSATYNSLAKFVKQAKESDKRFIFMQCAPADKFRREVVHELAHHFNCTSESQDDEPFRHVVVRAYKNKSAVPDFNIEQLLPVTE